MLFVQPGFGSLSVQACSTTSGTGSSPPPTMATRSSRFLRQHGLLRARCHLRFGFVHRLSVFVLRYFCIADGADRLRGWLRRQLTHLLEYPVSDGEID